MLFILGVSAQFLCPYPGYFSFWPQIIYFVFFYFPVRFNLVFLPGYIPDLRNMAFLPDTILSPDSFPFWFLPTDHLLILPDILRSEIPYQSINLMIIIHISCYNCSNLIFLLSFCHSPFIYRSCKDALNQGSLLKISLLRQPTPDCTLPLSPCLLSTGACHAPVIR